MFNNCVSVTFEYQDGTQDFSNRRVKMPWERKPYACTKCNKRFLLKGSQQRHLKYECGLKPVRDFIILKKSSIFLTSFVFPCINYLLYLQRFECPHCGRRSKQSATVYEHIRRKHAGQEIFVIDVQNAPVENSNVNQSWAQQQQGDWPDKSLS